MSNPVFGTLPSVLPDDPGRRQGLRSPSCSFQTLLGQIPVGFFFGTRPPLCHSLLSGGFFALWFCPGPNDSELYFLFFQATPLGSAIRFLNRNRDDPAKDLKLSFPRLLAALPPADFNLGQRFSVNLHQHRYRTFRCFSPLLWGSLGPWPDDLVAKGLRLSLFLAGLQAQPFFYIPRDFPPPPHVTFPPVVLAIPAKSELARAFHTSIPCTAFLSQFCLFLTPPCPTTPPVFCGRTVPDKPPSSRLPPFLGFPPFFSQSFIWTLKGLYGSTFCPTFPDRNSPFFDTPFPNWSDAH